MDLPPPDRRVALRALYERRRAEFHEAVHSVPDARWREPSTETAWTNAQLLMHIVDVLGRVPSQVQALRQGQNFRPFPDWSIRFLHPVQYLLVRVRAPRLTRAAVLERYDSAHERVLRAVDAIDEDEWERGGRIFGQGFFTLHGWLEFMAGHVDEHLHQLSRD